MLNGGFVRNFLFALFVIAFALPCLAQDIDPQTRLVLHTTADLDQNWFVTNWTIGNIKAETPNNISLFPGVGYRFGKWWVEAMIQRQWSHVGNSWALDFRYVVEPTNRTTLYAEYSPFLTKSGQYVFVYVNVRVWKQLAVGFETENVYRPGPDILDLGPRIVLPLISLGEYKLTLSAAYQIHHREADIPRLYVNLSRRFKR